ncbi:MAG: hypothetical protein QME57_00200 [Patescibacteria group bacterium]|nr:hypothetical protein [Patescibacteria group bacterium]
MKKILSVLILSALLLPTAMATAQQVYTLSGDLDEVIKKITNVLFSLLVAISVILFVYAGILFTTSAGDAEMVEKAKNVLFYAIVGLVIALLAKALQSFLIKMI